MDYVPAIVGGFLALYLYRKHLQKKGDLKI
jgi:predicted membrane-bound mannosyltransferase